jgi:23S rRNA (cytosine1962-C5)-methyltransferase
VERVEGEPAAGDVVAVASGSGGRLGFGDYDPQAQIRVRLHHTGIDPPPDEARWLEARLAGAIERRARIPSVPGTDAWRLVNAEGDDLPGLIVDRYARWLVLKATTPAMRRRARWLAKALAERAGALGAWLRGDRDEPGVPVAGAPPSEPIGIEEHGRGYRVDLRRGQKTGFYLDQRDARDLVETLAKGRRVLDLYAYTGGFSVAALRGGAATVTAVESSPAACALLACNAPGAERVHDRVEDFLARDARSFDLLVADPPPFARRKRDAEAAGRAHSALLSATLQRAAPGAHLLAFSCSHHFPLEWLRTSAASAARDARRAVRVLGTLGAPADHPVAVGHPEGEYLRGLWLEVDVG